ncbi:Flp family type IVb pilin [Frigidibacter sp.]|uniref:Flp family type IVb pilin n=1 Tax=Frigidibacter sp. TaxID=2586418 RepID=UPI00273290A6|nr:pilus assembly protein [Frigidibacter sp.]MDP3338802.1 pilus assembly protein [Frigidibacter sp.]
MKLINLFKNFRNDEDGAVTVDWVVLTAAVVGLGIIAMGAINTGVGDLTTDIGTSLTNVGTNTTIAAE